MTILQEELLRAGVLPADYDFEAHKKLVPMQPGDVPVTYADTTPLERATLALNRAHRCAKVCANLLNGTRNFITADYINKRSMMNMKIAVAGTGYVGLSLATLLAQHNEVKAVDIIRRRLN